MTKDSDALEDWLAAARNDATARPRRLDKGVIARGFKRLDPATQTDLVDTLVARDEIGSRVLISALGLRGADETLEQQVVRVWHPAGPDDLSRRVAYRFVVAASAQDRGRDAARIVAAFEKFTAYPGLIARLDDLVAEMTPLDDVLRDALRTAFEVDHGWMSQVEAWGLVGLALADADDRVLPTLRDYALATVRGLRTQPNTANEPTFRTNEVIRRYAATDAARALADEVTASETAPLPEPPPKKRWWRR